MFPILYCELLCYTRNTNKNLTGKDFQAWKMNYHSNKN